MRGKRYEVFMAPSAHRRYKKFDPLLQQKIIEILDARFEVVPRSIIEIINGIDDLSILKMLLKKAATIGSVEEFKQILEKTMS